MSVTVYKITCLATSRCYIGITVKPAALRFRQHKGDCLRGKTPGSRLHRAMRKYGLDSFSVDQIDVCSSWAEACEMEQAFVALFDTYANGYNATKGGEGTLGLRPTAETLTKLSAVRKGKPKSAEWKAKIGDANRGRVFPPVTDEARANMSAFQKGRPKSEEHKAKIRAAVAASWASGRTRKSKTNKSEEVAR